MRVFCLTDVETPTLQVRSLVGTSVNLGGVIIKPGESMEVPKVSPSEAQPLLQAGAIAIGQAPAWYVSAKAAKPIVPIPIEAKPLTPEVVDTETEDVSWTDPVEPDKPDESDEERYSKKKKKSGRKR